MNVLVNRKSCGKSLGSPNKVSSCKVSALKVNKTVQHDTNLVLGEFKDYYSNLARNFLKKLSKPPNSITKTLLRVILLILPLSPKTRS